MKSYIIPLLLVATASVVCTRLRGEPPAATPAATASVSSYETNLSKSASLIEQSRKNQEETHQRAMAMTARAEETMKRQEADLVRYEKILDTWERQQAQYQKYLDSLPKTK